MSVKEKEFRCSYLPAAAAALAEGAKLEGMEDEPGGRKTFLLSPVAKAAASVERFLAGESEAARFFNQFEGLRSAVRKDGRR